MGNYPEWIAKDFRQYMGKLTAEEIKAKAPECYGAIPDFVVQMVLLLRK